MTRSLGESFKVSGEWFLPDNPNRRIAGTLSYSEGQIELDLNERFAPLRGTIRIGDAPQIYPLIHGITRKGEATTLVDSWSNGGDFNLGSGGVIETERLISARLILGAHITAETTYPEAKFQIPGLQIWLSRKIFDSSFSRDETGQFTATYHAVGFSEEVSVREIDAKLILGVSCKLGTDPFVSITAVSSGWVIIKPNSPRQLNWYVDQLTKITTLLTFLAGAPMSEDLVDILVHDDPKIYAGVFGVQRDAKYCTFKNLHNFYMPRGALGDNFSNIVNRWFEVYEKVRVPSQLATSVLVPEKIWLNVEFLSLFHALEGFHRGLRDGNYMNPDDYKDVQKTLSDAIPNQVSSSHKDALRSRIRYGNQFSLAKRLDELAALLSQPVRALIFGRDEKVPRQWIDTRNYYSHWDEELKNDILDGQQMVYAVVRMRHFLRALYLNLIGVTQDLIHQALLNYSDESQSLAQVNIIQRRLVDTNDPSGIIMTIDKQNVDKPHGEDRPADPGADPTKSNPGTD